MSGSSEAPAPKKRGRKPNNEKRKADEMLEEAPPAKRKRGRGQKSSSGGEVLDTSGRANLQAILNATYKHLLELEVSDDSDTDEDGDKGDKRLIIGPFMSLPPKAQYADYYLIIRNPISMNQIKKKISREDYGSLREFREDVRTLANNAKTYNEDGSLLFQDATAIDVRSFAIPQSSPPFQPCLA